MTDEHTDAIPAGQASFLTPDLPRPTDGVAPSAPGQDPAASAPAPAPQPGIELDDKGNAWDHVVHDPSKTKTARGTWRLKGARGRPFSPGNKAAAIREPEPGAAPAAEPSPAAPRGFLGPDPAAPGAGGTPGADGAHIPEVIAPGPLGREQYKTTADAVVRAQFGAARLLLGPAWEPDAGETREWKEAWLDALHEWQAPRIGATLSLVVLAITSTGKRASDPQTRQAGAGIFRWIGSLFGMRPRPTQQERQTPAHQAPPQPQQTGTMAPVYKGW